MQVTDVMCAGEQRADIIRRVEGLTGTVRMHHDWRIRAWYGRSRPFLHRSDEALQAIAGPHSFRLTGPSLPAQAEAPGDESGSDLHVEAGE